MDVVRARISQHEPRVIRLKLCANTGVAATADFRSSSPHVLRPQLSGNQRRPDPRGHGADFVQAEPCSGFKGRLAVVVGAVPVVGIIAYLLLGEVNIGRRRAARIREALARMPEYEGGGTEAIIPQHYTNLFQVGHSVSGFEPVGGNSARLLADSNAAIDAIVADIDAAREHVHLIFYIWLPDNNGLKVVEALKRAAGRGVTCRAMVDGLGSRDACSAPPLGGDAGGRRASVASGPADRQSAVAAVPGRIDLRNHRKIVVIDNAITYCGSQNCADPEFRVKAKYAPWVDAMMRFEGPIARQNQHLFASDWMARRRRPRRSAAPPRRRASRPRDRSGDRHRADGPLFRDAGGVRVADVRRAPRARHHDALLRARRGAAGALCATAYRGVDTTIIFPARNDSWIVAAASRSYYADLLAAGVKIYEYEGGLLHTKSLTLDGEVTLIGSANMDRRSFELNYENNILFYDRKLAGSDAGRASGSISRGPGP